MKRLLLIPFLITNGLLAQSQGFPPGGGSSSGSPVFNGTTAVSSAFSATPAFSLAAIGTPPKSPARFEPGTMTANVTSVTITNASAGAKFSILWIQDGTGGRTVSYGATVSSSRPACAVLPFAGVSTLQFFEVESDGVTIDGAGCIGAGSGSPDQYNTEITAPTTPPAGAYACWADSTAHRGWQCMANNSATVFGLTVCGVDLNCANGNVTGTNGTALPISAASLKTNGSGQIVPGNAGTTFIVGTTGNTDAANRLSSNGDTNTTQATAANTAFGLSDQNTAANLFVGGSWYEVNFEFEVSTFSTSATLTIILQINGVTVYASNATAPTNSTSHAGLLMHCLIWSGATASTVSSTDPIYTQCGYTGPSAAWNFTTVQNVTQQPVTAVNPTTHFYINAAARWTGTIANNGNIIWGQVLKTARSF